MGAELKEGPALPCSPGLVPKLALLTGAGEAAGMTQHHGRGTEVSALKGEKCSGCYPKCKPLLCFTKYLVINVMIHE